MRKVIQLLQWRWRPETEAHLLALCDDGTIWRHGRDSLDWSKMVGPPRDDIDDPEPNQESLDFV